MSKLYLARHGESQWNSLKKIQGHKDIPLNNNGIKQANKLANRLLKEKIDIIYSSDLKRAFQTALIIGNKMNLEVTPAQEFREINFGPWEGLSIEEVNKKYKKEHIMWMKCPDKLKLEGAETLMDLQNRALSKAKEIMKKNPNKNILIVAHGVTIKSIILGILGLDISYYNRISLTNTSLSIIDFRQYNAVLELLNDTCHLKEDK